MKKKIVFENRMLYGILCMMRRITACFHNKDCVVLNRGRARLKKDCIGKGNSIQIGEGSILYDTAIRIRGNNNRLMIGENVQIGPGCSFWMEGNDISIVIGNNTTFTKAVHFCAQEDETSISVGEDCMFANTISVRTSDSHPIFDLSTGERLNKPHDVRIENHVWVAPNVKIMKGTVIYSGAIIGSDSMVTKSVEANSLAVGYPAKVVKRNIRWSRDKLF